MIDCLYDPFRHWAETGSIWMIGDTHFEDPDCRVMDKAWIGPEAQIRNLNRLAGKKDTLVILGDVGDPAWVRRLNAGQKILVMGNHDARGRYRNCFDEIYEGPVMIAPQILLSHEPVPLPFVLNIHGHDHFKKEAIPENCFCMNLAANVCDYTPANLELLIRWGALSNIPTIHRLATDEQIAKATMP